MNVLPVFFLMMASGGEGVSSDGDSVYERLRRIELEFPVRAAAAGKKKKPGQQEERTPSRRDYLLEDPRGGQDGEGRLHLRADEWFILSSGTIRSTEHQSPEHGGQTIEGTEMDLGDDFEIDRGQAPLFTLALDLFSNDRILLQGTYEDSIWKNVMSRDVTFNEAFYPAGAVMRSNLRHFRASLMYEREMLSWDWIGIPWDVSVRGGVANDRVAFKLTGDGLNGGGKRKGEDFPDELIPVLGITVQGELSSWGALTVSLDHGFKGIDLYWDPTQTSFTTVTAGVDIPLSKEAALTLGYRFDLIDSTLHGIEGDGDLAKNDFSLQQEGLFVGLKLSW